MTPRSEPLREDVPLDPFVFAFLGVRPRAVTTFQAVLPVVILFGTLAVPLLSAAKRAAGYPVLSRESENDGQITATALHCSSIHEQQPCGK